MVPELSKGGQGPLPTSPDGFRPEQGSVTDSVGWNLEERDLRRSKEKAAPLGIKVGGGEEDTGKALNSSPKANFRGEQRGLQSMLRPRVVVEWGGDDGLEGGHHLRLKKRNQGCRRSTPTHPAVVPQAVT